MNQRLKYDSLSSLLLCQLETIIEVEEVKVEVFRNIYGRGRTYSGAKLGKVRRGLQSLQLVLVGEVRRPEIIGCRRAVKMAMLVR